MSNFKCKNCGREITEHAKGMCITCYKKIVWKPKLKTCKRCGREKPMHAKGFCPGCYNSVFHLDKVKAHNARRYHNIEAEIYRKLTEKCKVCDFDKIVEIHHVDHNHENSSENNLVGLCPNCHKMLHSKKYQKEIFDNLKSQGYSVPEGYEMDGFFKKNH